MTEYVQVPIPKEHVPAVFDLLARLQKGEPAMASAAEDPVGERDQELVTRMYRESRDLHRRFLEHLASHPDRWVPSSELIEALDLPNGSKSLSGLMGAFSRRADHRYQHVMPWDHEWDRGRGEGVYRMPADVAGWIIEAARG